MRRSSPRIMLVSSSYPSHPADWRSRFILDMLESISERCAAGSEVLYWGPPGPMPSGARSVVGSHEAAWLGGLVERGGLAHLLRQRPLQGAIAGVRFLAMLNLACRREAAAYDVAHVNWMQNLLGLPRDGKPALVTVLGSDFGLLRVAGMRAALRRAMRARRCILAPNAPWMEPRLKTAFGDVARVVPVPFGVADAWYRVRREPQSRRRWLVVARVTRAKLGPLLAWGEGRFDHDDELHILGPMQEQIALPAWLHYHGATNPGELQDRWFRSAHGLITLSEHDEGRPQVLIEAMAAGLPVIASRLPAHSDLISDGVTGFLVDSPAAFGAAMQALADPSIERRIGDAAREHVRAELGTWRDTAMRYATLHEELFCGRDGGVACA